MGIAITFIMCLFILPYGHLSYCHHFASAIVCKLIHISLLHWNHWAYWNQTWWFIGWFSSKNAFFLSEIHDRNKRVLFVACLFFIYLL